MFVNDEVLTEMIDESKFYETNIQVRLRVRALEKLVTDQNDQINGLKAEINKKDN
jgi:hypothetical protein